MRPSEWNLRQVQRLAMTADESDLAAWSRSEEDHPGGVMLGVAICSIVPALFWCGVLWIGGHSMGMAPSSLTLVTVGASIAAFLTIVSSAVFAQR